jgi:hypothetical protein
MKKLLALLLTLLIAASLSSCASKMGAGSFATPIPAKGGPVDPSIWEAADGAPEGKGIDKATGRSWLFPFFFKLNFLEVAVNHNEARRSGFSWFDLSTPILMTFLPVHITYSRDFYNREQAEPVGSQRLTWNLFWASASEEGPALDPLKLRAYGVPLLFSRITGTQRDLEQRNRRFTWTTTLWTLGPMIVTYRDNKGVVTDGWFATPAQLGGFLGPLVWLSYKFKLDSGQFATAHGPLFGYLGVAHGRAPYMKGDRIIELPKAPGELPKTEPFEQMAKSHTLVLLGTLWESLVRSDEQGRVVRSSHGPLWGMFGWGRKDGGFALRFLWIPIRLGKKNPEFVGREWE